MPKLLPYTQSVPLEIGQGAVGGGRQISADAMGAGLGRAAVGLGDAMLRAGAMYGSQADEMEAEDLRVQLAQQQAEWTQEYVTRQAQAEPGDMQFAEKFTGDMTRRLDAIREGIQSKKALAAFDSQASAMVGHFGAKAMEFQIGLAGEKARIDWTTMEDAYARAVYNDPTQYGFALTQARQALDDPEGRFARLSPEHRMKFQASLEGRLGYAAMSGLAQTNPEFVLARLRPEELDKFKTTNRIARATATGQTFQEASRFVLAQEGGYNPHDGKSGAPVNFGINQRANPDIDVARLTPEKATEILKDRYWNAVGADQLPPTLATVAFDTAVNMGVGAAKKLLDQSGGDVDRLLDLRRQRYREIARDPAQAQYLPWWLSRVDALQAKVAAMDAAGLMSPSEAPGRPGPLRMGMAAFDGLTWEQQSRIVAEAEQGVRANMIRDEQRDKLAQAARQAQLKAVQDDFLARMLPGAENPLTVDDVRNSPLEPFGSGSKEWFYDAIQKQGHADAKTDPIVFNTLFESIHLPADDPRSVKDEDQLLPWLGKGLAFDDLNRLRGELQGKKTAAGAVENDLKQQAFRMAYDVLAKPDRLTGVPDPDGAKLNYQFRVMFQDEYDRLRKDGKPAVQLLDPRSPDYLPGRLMGMLATTPMERIAKTAEKIRGDFKTAPAAPQKKEGESAAEYLARVKGN